MVREKLHKVILIILVFAVGLVLASKILFTHTHILDDGTKITHWHLYFNTDDEGHPTHTHTELSIEDLYKIQFTFFLFLAFFVAALIATTTQPYISASGRIQNAHVAIRLGRAPPLKA